MLDPHKTHPVRQVLSDYRSAVAVVLGSLIVVGGWIGLLLLLASALPDWMRGRRCYHLGDSAWSATLMLAFLTVLFCIALRSPARRWRIFHLIAAVPALAVGAVTAALAWFVPPRSHPADPVILTAVASAAAIYVIFELQAWWRRGRGSSIPPARIRPR